MSGSPEDPFTTLSRGSTAPTPGFRRATTVPAVPREHEGSLPQRGRGGSHRVTQGCSTTIAYTPDVRTRSRCETRQVAANGRAASPSGNLSLQPPRPATVRVTSQYGATRTTATAADRSRCKGKLGAHDPRRAGTSSAYKNFSCRCPDAVEAYRIYRKRYRFGRFHSADQRVDATASRRRLQALACIGWPLTELAFQLDMDRNQVSRIRLGRQSHVHNRTQTAIQGIYHKLADYPHGGDTRTAIWAAKRKWAPPIAWDEDTICDPNAKPQHLAKDHGDHSVNEDVDLQLLAEGRAKNFDGERDTPAARRRFRSLAVRAVHILTERGDSVPAIAAKLSITERQVERWRKINPGDYVGADSFNEDRSETTPSGETPEEASAA